MTSRRLHPFTALVMVLGISLGIAACSGTSQRKSPDQGASTEQKPTEPQDILGGP